MTLVKDIIKRGMRTLGIIQSGEEPSAAEAVDALQVLNEMMHAFELDGIRLEYTSLEYEDTFHYPDNHIQPLMYCFAMRYGAEFGVQPSPVVASAADNGYRNLQSYYYDPEETRVDSALHSCYNSNRWFR